MSPVVRVRSYDYCDECPVTRVVVLPESPWKVPWVCVSLSELSSGNRGLNHGDLSSRSHLLSLNRFDGLVSGLIGYSPKSGSLMSLVRYQY